MLMIFFLANFKFFQVVFIPRDPVKSGPRVKDNLPLHPRSEPQGVPVCGDPALHGSDVPFSRQRL